MDHGIKLVEMKWRAFRFVFNLYEESVSNNWKTTVLIFRTSHFLAREDEPIFTRRTDVLFKRIPISDKTHFMKPIPFLYNPM